MYPDVDPLFFWCITGWGTKHTVHGNSVQMETMLQTLPFLIQTDSLDGTGGYALESSEFYFCFGISIILLPDISTAAPCEIRPPVPPTIDPVAVPELTPQTRTVIGL
jgi:hypothetical protein